MDIEPPTDGRGTTPRLLRIDVEEVGPLLASTPPGAGGVRALPYLSNSGERAPFVDATARAQFTGLSLESTSGEIVRALCESIAYAARHCFESVGLTGRLYADEALGEEFDQDRWAAGARTVEVCPENVDHYERGYADHQASLAAARGLWSL